MLCLFLLGGIVDMWDGDNALFAAGYGCCTCAWNGCVTVSWKVCGWHACQLVALPSSSTVSRLSCLAVVQRPHSISLGIRAIGCLRHSLGILYAD
jgi:hypothetical protein